MSKDGGTLILNRPIPGVILTWLIFLVILPLPALTQDEAVVEPPTDSILLSSVHLWQGDQDFQQGAIESATENYLAAARYMRTSPDPHFALARVYIRSSVMDAFLEFATGLKLLLSDFFYQSVLISNVALVLLIATAASIYAAVIMVIVKRARTLWFSGLITFSPLFRSGYLKVVLIASMLAVVVLLSGHSLLGLVTWALVLGCGLCWRFAGASERRIIVVFALFLCVSGPLIKGISQIVSTQHPRSPLRLVTVADKVPTQRLTEMIQATPGDGYYNPIVEFIQGLINLNTKEYEAAIEHLNVASKLTPNNPAILNNLGVALHGLDRYTEARASFQQALRLAPREAIIHYNYSQTLNALLYYDQAQDALARASTLDFELTRTLVTSRELELVPMNLQSRFLWRLAMLPGSVMLHVDYSPVESGTAGSLVLICLTGLALFLTRTAKCPARCDVCGALVQSQVARRRRRDLLCTACQAIKAANEKDHESIDRGLEDRVNRLANRNAIIAIAVGLLVPGSTYHMSGHRAKGVMIGIAIYALLILALSGGEIIAPVPRLKLLPPVGWSLPAFIFFYALYAWRSTVHTIKTFREE
jgi:tetratricopeptide (TPR) repeat protein